jgi:hypothetical protein
MDVQSEATREADMTDATRIDEWQEGLACRRHGLGTKWGGLDDCPNHGSSDCPITMGEHGEDATRSCKSEEWYEELAFVLRHRCG